MSRDVLIKTWAAKNEGRIHRDLKEKAVKYLKFWGYQDIHLESTNRKMPRFDVIAFEDGLPTIAIECGSVRDVGKYDNYLFPVLHWWGWYDKPHKMGNCPYCMKNLYGSIK